VEGEEAMSVAAERHRPPWDWPFLLVLAAVGGTYVVLIVAMLVADACFTTPGHLLSALQSKEIRYAVWLSLISCTITTILSLLVAVPLGYLLSRWEAVADPAVALAPEAVRSPLRIGLRVTKTAVDALLDVPIVLPPLVVGLSLLILFQTWPAAQLEWLTEKRMGMALARVVLPSLGGLLVAGVARKALRRASVAWVAFALWWAANLAFVLATPAGRAYEGFLQEHFATPITYAVPSVILAQFAVSCAFAVRTMRIAFDQITPRCEQVALTLGCSRSQAFWWVVLPEARRGLVTAGTLAWARALGEFGPVLVFSGATRLRTEVLPTTVFLELSVGNLQAAVSVSLLMVAAALVVLFIVRVYGVGRT
jgi:molybdate transport system permease protein